MKKAITLLLTLALLCSLCAMGAAAADTYTLTDASVALDGTADKTVTVSLVCDKAGTVYGLQGKWDTAAAEGKLSLSALTPAAEVSANENSAENGSVLWLDSTYNAGITSAAAEPIWTATYTVDKDTPAGEYTVSFKNVNLVDGNGDGLSLGTLSATVTVTRDAPADYTVTLADNTAGTAEVVVGTAFTVTVTVTGGDAQPFNGIEGTVTYDKDHFQLTAATGDAAPESVSDTGSVRLYAISKTDYASGAVVATLTFTAKAVGEEIDFAVAATVGDFEDFQTHDAVEAAAVGDKVTVLPVLTVEVTQYVTGINLVLVTGNAAGYSYGGQAMYKVAAYGENVFACLDAAAGLDETAAAAKVTAAAATAADHVLAAGYDVNGTGKVDFNDAGAAFGCYNVVYTLGADTLAMYLRADVNGDKKVDGADVSAVMDNYS